MKATSGRKSSSAEGKKLGIKIQSFGPTPEQVQALARSVTRHRAVQSYLAKTRSRLLRVDLLEPAQETKLAKPKPPDRFRAVFYDYTNNRTVLAIGRVAKLMALEVTESGLQPRPSDEEFEDAVSIVREHPELGMALREQRLLPYPAMPPLVGEELPDGRVERTIAVGLLPREGAQGHEIVAVNMIQRKTIRFEPSTRGRAPLTAAAHNPICGFPYAGQSTASAVAGSAWVTVTQGGVTVWKFLVVRPAASSGTNGSGIELRYLDYRGKRVFYRAHVPILNVKYDGNACGPYRDWQSRPTVQILRPVFVFALPPPKPYSTQATIPAISLALGFTCKARKWSWLAKWRRAGIVTSANGGCTPTARFARASGSPRYRAHASVTSIITTFIGASISISGRPETTLCASSMIRRCSAVRSGTTRRSRSAARATRRANASGASRIKEPARRMTSFPTREMA
jgi:hypothetical protein